MPANPIQSKGPSGREKSNVVTAPAVEYFTRHFILDTDHNVVPANIVTWMRFFENDDNRQMKLDHHGGACVSTVFTGLPFASEVAAKLANPPLVFETRVFGGALDGETKRYASWNDAVAGHAAIFARVIAASAS